MQEAIMEKLATLKAKLNNDGVATGMFLNLGSLPATYICANSGFDWMLIDLEHGSGSEADLLPQILAVASSSSISIVRVPGIGSPLVQRALDLGADGIMIPRVNSVKEATSAIEATLFPPKGTRGIAQLTFASQFGSRTMTLANSQEEERLVVLQVETEEAVENAEKIADLIGVDVLFVGPSDLSMSMGRFWQLDDKSFLSNLEHSAKVIRGAGKAAGILASDEVTAKRYFDMGYNFIGVSADSGYLARSTRSMAQSLKSVIG